MDPSLSQQIRVYFAEREEVAAVYLFGSQVSGRATDCSDVDIGILLKRKEAKFADRHIRRYLTQLPRRIRKDVHPVIMNFAGERTTKQIYEKGKCLLLKEPREASLFKMVMYARIADFSPYLQQIQRKFVRKMVEI